ncbi:alkyl/aryl-sulfatase [Enterocloster asparagiformis]|uniref:Metallo-beta-lactamase domain protein n=2 Tax=Enterocloster asparagiformis TaxID=333367 RepID=C0D6K1_9FIRM|nr:alkyl/aryl-sulfatase [Enterocloster asparagiformis]EEG53024.1 metallo-beta-lactamase domain protein [[Clostridium] asparagiforme DSM 15981]RGX25492.1 alkyl/aryl-sulfatase [Enterocloster asparagiformis]UWO78038.1 alkyl/aryl-sulfatase [[Clostridium] asparagiforme DSM 15981]
MTGEEKLRKFTEEQYKKQVTKVKHRIYHFLGWGHSNATAIIGETSVILVDMLDSDERAKRLRAELATITDKPVRTIIYTHSHPDHRGGAGAFRDTVEEIIAFKARTEPLDGYGRIAAALNQRGEFQFGYELTDEENISQGIGPREGKAVGDGVYDFMPPTTVYDVDTTTRTIDGVTMELTAAPGETDDQLFVWLEEDKVMISGDNYYGCWPNLYAIRGTQYRDIAQWIKTLEKILSYPAEALLPGHTAPLIGRDQILEVVGNFKNAIASVFDQTLDCLGRGLTLAETVESVRLPEELRDKEYLGEYYGTVEWSVKGIYNGYVGWFDGDAAHLMPCPRREFSAAVLELAGGPDKLLAKALSCLEKGESQLALELLELLGGEAQSGKIKEVKRRALLARAAQMTSANARHYYICSAKEI